MDPLTAGLTLANTIAEIVKVAMDGATPEQRQQMAQHMLDSQTRWQNFLDRFKHD